MIDHVDCNVVFEYYVYRGFTMMCTVRGLQMLTVYVVDCARGGSCLLEVSHDHELVFNVLKMLMLMFGFS